ncbi:MAG: amidohydrolase [Alphaproteobacteria bacterium]|nr:amidohydrolase [Alphaproteobacteria bacterium]
MAVIDMHSHWATKRGYPLQTEQELAQQEKTWRSRPRYRSEEEMAGDLQEAGVRAILDFGYTKFLPIEQAAPVHDYGFETQRRYPDRIIGHWLHFQPELGRPALDEFRRCIDAAPGFVGLAVSGSGGVPASDDAYRPFYDLCIEARVPALIFVGTTGLGAGLPGGKGILLDHCHPRHLDRVAAEYPDLTIVAARPAWPWQSEMIAVMLHKPNVWYELHGWSPKYFTAELKHDIPRRLRDRVMFGADYPLLSYQRTIAEWRELGYADEVMDKILHANAERFLATVRG